MKELNRRGVLKSVGILGVAVLGTEAEAAERAGAAGTFTGGVEDLNFRTDMNWCEVTLRRGDERLAAITTEPRVQSLLELAFATGKNVEASYRDGKAKVLTAVKVSREAAGD